MSTDNISFHQRIKKFSRFLTTKVKEKTHHVFNDSDHDNIINGGGGIVRRHSSYIQSSPIVEFTEYSYDDSTTFKQEEEIYQHFNTMPSPVTATNNTISLPITAALSPPPRHLKNKKENSLNKSNPAFLSSTISSTSKPCLSRSNTLGHHHSSSDTSILVKYATITANCTPNTPTATPAGNQHAPILINNHSSSFCSSTSSSSICSLTGHQHQQQQRCNINNKAQPMPFTL